MAGELIRCRFCHDEFFPDEIMASHERCPRCRVPLSASAPYSLEDSGRLGASPPRADRLHTGLIESLAALALYYSRLADLNRGLHVSSSQEAERLLRRVVVPLLDVLGDWANEHPELGAGLYESSWDLAAGEGVERIEPSPGASFAADEHHAVGHPTGRPTGGHISEVIRVGYRWKGRVLRPALVRVQGAG